MGHSRRLLNSPQVVRLSNVTVSVANADREYGANLCYRFNVSDRIRGCVRGPCKHEFAHCGTHSSLLRNPIEAHANTQTNSKTQNTVRNLSASAKRLRFEIPVVFLFYRRTRQVRVGIPPLLSVKLLVKGDSFWRARSLLRYLTYTTHPTSQVRL